MEIEHSDQKYRVLRELGRGHSGTVYLALDPRDREVAIKCLLSQTNEAMLQRFRQEFAILRSLQHPHIAQPIDFGFDERLRRHFFVAEYVGGVTLDVALHTASEEEAARLFAQALRALDYMHRQGVYHCDLKPGNILVTHEKILKIIDFDVAVRGTQAIGGTPSYCAPELLTGDEPQPNPKTDLFSIGATFYHCLTREKPFHARTYAELVVAHGTQRPKLPSQINPRLGTLWDGLLLGLLQIQSSRRFATASAVLQQLYPLLGEKRFPLSESDIAYRLRQAGKPVGKDILLNQIQYFLDSPAAAEPESRLAVIQAGPGLGSSYLSAEIKAMAQLKGIPCFVFQAQAEAIPDRFPCVWILDELARLQQERGPDFAASLAAKLREVGYKAGESPCWIFALGAEAPPAEWRELWDKAKLRLALQPWSETETRAWLEDVFQTESIPHFLVAQLQEAGGGRPKRISQLLQHYLRENLILDAQGHWRKDLLQPSELYRRAFVSDTAAENYESLVSGLSPEEAKILRALALAYAPLPGRFFAAWLETETAYGALRRLVALGALKVGEDDGHRLAASGLKDFLLNSLAPDQLRAEHDRWAALAEDPRFAEFFPPESVAFHRAHGGDPQKAAEAWAAFGDRNARAGLWQSARECYGKALVATPESESESRFRYAIDAGRCIVQGGHLEEGKAYFDRLLKQFTQDRNQNRLFLAKICERQGLIETKLGKLDKAREFFRAGLRCLEPGREPVEQYLALKNFLAGLDLLSGRNAEAIAAYRETHALAAALPWEQRRVLTNNDLGAALLQDGRFEDAVAHWRSELEDLRRREDANPYVRCLYQLGQAHLDRGMREPARDYLERAAAAAQGLQNPEMELRILNALANLWKEEDREKSLADYERALDVAFQANETRSIGVILLNMGFLLAEMEQTARARHCLHQGVRTLRGLPDAESRYGQALREAQEEIVRLGHALRGESEGGLKLGPLEKA